MVEIEEILWEKQIQISKDREKRVIIYIYIYIHQNKWAHRAW